MIPDEGPPETTPPARPRRRRLPAIVFLVFGLGVALYLSRTAPGEQHVRFVLGGGAGAVRALEVQYVADDGETARATRMTFDQGDAPRVVAHDPELPDGDYRLEIVLETTEGRRAAERRVTLSGGTTSVDLAGVLTRAP